MFNVKKTLTKLLTLFNPTAASVETITLNGFFKDLFGGVWKVGKFVFVNISVYVDGTFAANDYYTLSNNFPNANINSALTVTTAYNAGNRGAVASVNTSGECVVQSGANALTNYTLYITGIYLGGN